MAFSTKLVNPYTATEVASYSRAALVGCNKQTTVVLIQHFLSAESAKLGAEPISSASISVGTNLQLEASNPVDYAYKLLEASGEFPEATWNI